MADERAEHKPEPVELLGWLSSRCLECVGTDRVECNVHRAQRRNPLKRSISTVTVTAALIVAGTGVASADPGAPGTTFPEQPGTHTQTACAAVTTGPGQGISHASPTAGVVLTGLIEDACLGG